ncbi:MAG: glycine C-acetyltransferase [Sedimentisphaerales bacterium]|mgnify:FL=1|jgi:glycine C-acetyltransferase|nr:glycine C-acetyltransferase [Sedimentisphaerales bacterium]HNY77430.1 glycine C-acetyltransferase [Sedimentisphaerales bacterium]HOC62834.1 glycine C-acetyltransferase [Sedimentisphaerales bacterium]HOH63680.1 glycine C-acetyltransferase [Sedimentisphaerales bacterium]HPY49321.1 glycine C-acetyltransferase [Sedimentisphaerales bacterium]
MYRDMKTHLSQQLAEIRQGGLEKPERVITSPQSNHITTSSGQSVLNMCANNYLGLANHPAVMAAARESYEKWGFGLASVRFICGTQQIHKDLEAAVTRFLGTEDTIVYGSCFDANGGLFETLLGPEDTIISDQLNHASIIDGVRLCKAQRLRYSNSDMADLEEQLKAARSARFRLIATDGVFSMDGYVAKLDAICELADRYDAMVMIDDCHATGVIGKTGRGTPEYRSVMGRVDVITGTFGKALGGASGGFTSGRKEIIAMLRQRSRPYLFSNTLAPAVAAGSIKALELLDKSTELLDRLADNTRYFRQHIARTGLKVLPGDHPITPIILGEATLAQEMAQRLLAKGLYVIGFSFPVVPKGQARIRTQVSAAHTQDDLDFAVEKFAEVARELALTT